MLGVIRYNQIMGISEIFTKMKNRAILISLRARTSLTLFTFALFLMLFLSSFQARSANASANELWSVYSFDSTSAVATYFLKQETYFSVGKFLRQVGADRELGPKWTNDNPWWRQAEEALIERVEPDVVNDYHTHEWMLPEWTLIVKDKFKDQEMEQLVAHFKTNIGMKKASVIDHGIARQVMVSLTFSGKLKSPLKHLHDDLESMQETYHREEKNMQFVTTDLDGAAAQTFALSHLGKEHFTTLIISVTERINEELDHLSLKSEMLTLEHAQAIDSYVSGFLQDY